MHDSGVSGQVKAKHFAHHTAQKELGHIMFNSLLEYPITRPLSLGICFNVAIIVLGIAWVALITVFNVAAVAYELVPITTTQFSNSYTLWYEGFIPSSWVSAARTCNGSLISLNEGIWPRCNANI